MSRSINRTEEWSELRRTMCSPNHFKLVQHKRQQYLRSMDYLIIGIDSNLCLHGSPMNMIVHSSSKCWLDIDRRMNCNNERDSLFCFTLFTVPSPASTSHATTVSPTTEPQGKWKRKNDTLPLTPFVLVSSVLFQCSYLSWFPSQRIR